MRCAFGQTGAAALQLLAFGRILLLLPRKQDGSAACHNHAGPYYRASSVIKPGGSAATTAPDLITELAR